MKNIFIKIIILSTAIFMAGCVSPTLSHKEILTSSKYKHNELIIDIPYSKGVKNLEVGLKKCAKNMKSSTIMRGVNVVMPPDTRYHTFDKSKNRAEYNHRFFMGGVMEGSCFICQPKNGFYEIYIVLSKFGNKTKVTTHINRIHTLLGYDKEVQAILKWIKGDTSSCHKFFK